MILSSAYDRFSAKSILTHYEEDDALLGSTRLRFDEGSNLFLLLATISERNMCKGLMVFISTSDSEVAL